MKPPPFHYHDPETVSDAVGLLSRLENPKLLAGGQSLMAMMNMRYAQPDHVIDLNRIADLAYVRRDGGSLRIGAMTRQRNLEFSELVRDACPVLHEAIFHIGHRQTRNRGTIGGSLCHLDPSAELAAIAALHDAVLTIRGTRGSRDIAFGDFAVGFMTPALEPDELLVEICLPLWPQPHGHAFIEFARRHGDFAMASAAALLSTDSAGRIERAALAVGGVAATPVRVTEGERLLLGKSLDEATLKAAAEACKTIEPLDDIHAPADYRRHLGEVLAFRALKKAAGRLQPGGR